jgi:hypothetical protein
MGFSGYFNVYENIEGIKIPQNKQVKNYGSCENTKIPLIQRYPFC